MTPPKWHEHKFYKVSKKPRQIQTVGLIVRPVEDRKSHQRWLCAAVCGFIIWEEQHVLGEHGHGSQHERHKQVQVDVVSSAVKPPASTHTHTHTKMWLSVFMEGVTPVMDVVSKHAEWGAGAAPDTHAHQTGRFPTRLHAYLQKDMMKVPVSRATRERLWPSVDRTLTSL